MKKLIFTITLCLASFGLAQAGDEDRAQGNEELKRIVEEVMQKEDSGRKLEIATAIFGVALLGTYPVGCYLLKAPFLKKESFKGFLNTCFYLPAYPCVCCNPPSRLALFAWHRVLGLSFAGCAIGSLVKAIKKGLGEKGSFL